eukprot:1943912-Rhodomonas_salina.1
MMMQTGIGYVCGQRHTLHASKQALRLWITMYATWIAPPLVLYEQPHPTTPIGSCRSGRGETRARAREQQQRGGWCSPARACGSR